jgi:hypothetical protein
VAGPLTPASSQPNWRSTPPPGSSPRWGRRRLRPRAVPRSQRA